VQDGGRPGFAHLGVPRSGALDRAAAALANRLVGNPEGAAVLETTLDGVGLRLEGQAVVAVTGAKAAVRLDGRPAAWGMPVYVPGGSVLDVGRAELGARSYLAVDGGFDTPQVLGSRSTDVLSGFGPPPLTTGERLPIGWPCGPVPPVDFAPYRFPAPEILVPLHPGPRGDWMTPAAEEALFTRQFRVSPTSNRVALRLAGPPLERSQVEELPSEGLVWGSVQLVASGQILVFLADHPTTGGYPVVAVADRAAGPGCAQARPGDAVRFQRARPVSGQGPSRRR